jgi:Transglycosylase-like domain
MRNRIAATALGVALLGAPAVAQSDDEKGQPGYEEAVNAALENGDYNPHEDRYLRLYNRYAEEFGVRSAGRNIVLFGLRTESGERPAPESEVVGDAETMAAALRPPAEASAPAATTAEAATAGYGGAAASSATAQCESGGDYGAVNPAGYYGAYQFDQSTWDVYAPEGYAGTNPAAAPPAVQDQAAANVPYDAWPNC